MSKLNFNLAHFFITVNDLQCLPVEPRQEFAICGRSNSGKSSMINTLTNKTRLAFTSKTPGRTQHINYFQLGDSDIFMVDLPGYGYAKVPEKIRTHWQGLLGTYLQTRPMLTGLVLIMDSRHPLKELDYIMLEFFAETKKPIHIVLSKSDKLNQREKVETLRDVKQKLVDEGFSNFTIQLFSAPKRQGIPELETALNSWVTE
jgi:GTP-binding protein